MRRPKSTPPEQQEHQWAITLIRQRGKFLGYVKAPDQKSAIQDAINHFGIKDPEQQSGWSRSAVIDTSFE
jgi:hypothetical protein